LVFVVGILVVIQALLKAPLELKLFILFAALIFSAALASPVVSTEIPQWQAMTIPGAGQRYYFIPMLAFTATLVWTRSKQSLPRLRKIATTALLAMLIGIISDYSLPPFQDFNFRESVKKFEAAPKGTDVVIPIPPPNWSMTLNKH
jgi:hypothetical protein